MKQGEADCAEGLGLVPGLCFCVTSCIKRSSLKQPPFYLLRDSVCQEFGQCSAREFFCPTWYEVAGWNSASGMAGLEGPRWLHSKQLAPTSSGWLEGWAPLGLAAGVPVGVLLSVVVPGFVHDSLKLPRDPGRN